MTVSKRDCERECIRGGRGYRVGGTEWERNFMSESNCESKRK